MGSSVATSTDRSKSAHTYARFSMDEDDRRIERDIDATDLREVKYKIITRTGDIRGAGTDANVFITLHGEKVCRFVRRLHLTECSQGESGQRNLVNGGRNNFERNQVDTFILDCIDIGI